MPLVGAAAVRHGPAPTITGMRLMLLEDDELLGDGLREYLRGEGHVVDWCRSLAELRGLREEPYDALLLDWQLGDGSGLAWLKARRGEGDATPALMLTARDLLHDRIEGLDAGADDYLVKPFAPEELTARLRALLRRSAGLTAQKRRYFGQVAVDLAAKRVSVNEEAVELTGREWAVLEALVLRPGRLMSKSQLERIVLGFDGEVASNAIEVHVSALRRKLGRSLIQTVRGLGYRIEPPAAES
jgi:two-component system, OmpR family, response regulator